MVVVREHLRRVGGVEVRDGHFVAVISAQERNLLQRINDLRFGRIERITVKDGQPMHLESVRTIEQAKL